jgi:mRNA-degrading endonuclease RelE of RelBE toxin-antitoxin system
VIELPPFSRKWEEYRLTEIDRSALLQAVLNDPESSPVIKGTAGARKARFGSHELDRGKSGGYRVFYAVFRKYGKIVLVTLFPKNMQANLSKAAQNRVAQLIREIEAEMEQIDREERAQARKRRR